MTAYKSDRKPDRRTIFTTLDSTEIHFVPFSWDEYMLAKQGLLEEYRERGEVIDCPQYKITFASGSSQWFNHDEKSILQVPPGTKPEDIERVIQEQKETWTKYQETLTRFNAEDNALMVDFVFSDSIGDIQLPEDNSWEEKQRRRRVKIPADPEEKRRHYINTVLCKGRSDQLDLIATIMAISMGAVKEDDVQAVIRSFRDRFWSQARPFFGDAAGTIETGQPGRVEQQSALRSAEGGESLGTDALPIPGTAL
jgi:hypothetical protein